MPSSRAHSDFELAALPGLFWTTDSEFRVGWCTGSSDIPGLQLTIGQSITQAVVDGAEAARLVAAHERARHGEVVALEAADRTWIAQVGPLPDGSGCQGVALPGPRPRQEPRTVAGEVDVSRSPVDDDRTPTESAVVQLSSARLEARWRAVVDLMSEYLVFTDLEGRIVDVNRFSPAVPREVVIGRRLHEFAPSENHARLEEAMQEVRESLRVTTFQMRGNRGGEMRWFSARMGPVFHKTELVGLVILASDITERRQAEDRLKAEQGLLRRLLELQDRERRLLAYDIHDGLLQDVVGGQLIIQSMCETARSDPSTSLTADLDRTQEILAKAINEGRRLISELRPMIIDEMGIVEALRYLAGEYDSESFHIDLCIRVSFDRLAPLLEGTLFRIVQESINNARRHGQADHVTLRLTQVGDHIVLEVQDNGIGFDPESVPSDRFGLAGIRERARLFGGGATIESAAGQGSRVTVKLPLRLPSEPNEPTGRWTWSI